MRTVDHDEAINAVLSIPNIASPDLRFSHEERAIFASAMAIAINAISTIDVLDGLLQVLAFTIIINARSADAVNTSDARNDVLGFDGNLLCRCINHGLDVSLDALCSLNHIHLGTILLGPLFRSHCLILGNDTLLPGLVLGVCICLNCLDSRSLASTAISRGAVHSSHLGSNAGAPTRGRGGHFGLNWGLSRGLKRRS
jgi:hypothetical protein